MSLFALAETMETIIMISVRKAVKVNTGSIPKKAILAGNNQGKIVLIQDLKIGDIIAIRAGEMIMADGRI